jgi:hypothetical protein
MNAKKTDCSAQDTLDEVVAMKYLTYLTCVTLLCFSFASCDKKVISPSQDTTYFNSFESARDTTGWLGMTEEMFVSDPAPKGGNRSLHIAGGCLQPTTYIDLPAQTHDGDYRVNCWGKLEDASRGGKIVLAIHPEGENRGEMQLIIAGEEWTFFESEKSLHCPKNQRLRLEIWIGGFAPASMFIDCIEVEKVK